MSERKRPRFESARPFGARRLWPVGGRRSGHAWDIGTHVRSNRDDVCCSCLPVIATPGGGEH
ncbi:MAG: hypothetical protein ABEH88_12345, partial [Halobacteriales archaeon]